MDSPTVVMSIEKHNITNKLNSENSRSNKLRQLLNSTQWLIPDLTFEFKLLL